MSKKKRNERQRKAATTPGHYFRRLADRMELRDWTVTVMHRHAEEGVDAQVECVYGRKIVKVSLPPDWRHRSPEERRQTAVHELIHAHLNAADQCVRNTEAIMGKPAYAVAYEAYHDQREIAVDALADVIAPHMPLPEDGE